MGGALRFRTQVKSVSIGIPAYNEEQNIASLLEDLAKQKQDTFILDSIFVYSDCSTDTTAKIVKKYVRNNKRIHLLEGPKRIGKIASLKHIFQINVSDFLVLFDADVKLSDAYVLEHFVKTFETKKSAVVGGVDIPSTPQNFFEKIAVTWITIWDRAKRDRRNFTKMHLFSARAMAFTYDFVKKVSIPDSAIVDDQFIYLKALEMKEKVSFASHAVVYYRVPSTFSEYLIQSTRYLNLNQHIASHFGSWVQRHYPLHKSAKRDSLLYEFIHNPFYTVCAVGLQVIVRFSKYWLKEDYSFGFWTNLASTKSV